MRHEKDVAIILHGSNLILLSFSRFFLFASPPAVDVLTAKLTIYLKERVESGCQRWMMENCNRLRCNKNKTSLKANQSWFEGTFEREIFTLLSFEGKVMGKLKIERQRRIGKTIKNLFDSHWKKIQEGGKLVILNLIVGNTLQLELWKSSGNWLRIYQYLFYCLPLNNSRGNLVNFYRLAHLTL
jgi:hypothetical protein